MPCAAGNSNLDDFTDFPTSFDVDDPHCAPSVLAGLYDISLYPGASVNDRFNLSGTQWNSKRERDDSFGIVQFFISRYNMLSLRARYRVPVSIR